ncbi:glycosyltransferase family 4 protein [Kineococcus glutinatus]|uniref:Glycosyltransferase involved in cell wall biosynthesis n=1 Tax=Kineococcus glutinatus TaxID=1070872 RepID=A0ABP9HCJ2_9ACTN
MGQVFTVGRGQYENIGDAILRRQLIDWVRDAGQPHVYVGRSPAGYDESLGLQPSDHAYRSLGAWYRAALLAALRGDAAYVFKPGEIQLSLAGMKEHLVVVPLLAVLRARGGRAVRVGVGARSFAPLPRALMWPSIALSDVTKWRDDATAAYMRVGESMPDLAFGEGSDDDALAEPRTRDALVVSLRGDGERPYPSPAAIAGLRAYAERHGLQIWAVTQVSLDDERSRRLAQDLGGQVLGWPGATGHHEHEAALRELYRRTSVVVSDRLHVVIGAYTEGAVPVAGLVRPAPKLERHLSTIGVDDIVLDLDSADADAVTERLEVLVARRGEVLARLAEARVRLEAVRKEVLAVLGSAGARRRGAGVPGPGPVRPTVYHLGRAGEVAGGMTQVLNGYLAGTFDRVDVDLVTTRGNPGDLVTSARRAAGAATRLLRLPRGRSVVAAHLSAGGSFVREGALMRLARARGLATVAHLHGSSFVAFAERRPRLVRWVLGAADHVVSLSSATSAVAERSVPAPRVHLIPNAVRLGTPATKENVVVFGGAVGRRKGVDVLLQAWSRVDAPGWKLLIAGPVLEPDVVRETHGATLLGALPHEELLELLERSRVAVLPSRDEAMPVFVLEAMARRNAVVATDVGGVAPVLAGGRGLVVPPADVEALRSALQRVISDDALREGVAEAAWAAARDTYSTDAVHPQLEQVWLDALGADSPAVPDARPQVRTA